MYTSFLGISGALHLDLFDQPVKNLLHLSYNLPLRMGKKMRKEMSLEVIEAETRRNVRCSFFSSDEQLLCLGKNSADTRDRDLE